MKDKYKRYIVPALAILVVLLGAILFCTTFKGRIRVDSYDKYALTIHISAVKESGTKETKIVKVNYDGSTSSISLVPDAIKYSGYLVDNTIYYEKDNVSSKLEVHKKYTDLYDYFKNLKDYDEESKTAYYILLTPREVSDILDCLYFEKKTEKSVQGKLTLKDEKIASFNMKIGGIAGYEEVDLSFRFEELKDDYKINIPKKIIASSKDTTYNPFTIIK